MRHRSSITKFSRDTKSRKALFKSLVRALVEQGKIVTTEAKAKEAKRIADKLIGKAKNDSTATRRVLHRFFGVRDVVNTMVDRIAPQFSDRNSGFIRITKVGVRRGDNVPMAELSLVNAPETVGTLKNVAKAQAKKAEAVKTETVKKAPAKKAPAKKAVKKETK
ncbi:MAG: hypothetical protein BroJett025_06750 [Patescibacteria group bacterium]|nr:MAG: hypothetical protein BroJett025_06750 [Patescibacteria group bacterium]